MNNKVRAFLRRKNRTNTIAKLSSTHPRLIVSRSNKHIHAQVINSEGKVLASSYDIGLTGTKKEKAFQVGKVLGERASSQGVSAVVFDRNGYLYHGRVAQVAQGAREAGLIF